MLISLLVALLVLAIVVWLLNLIIAQLALPPVVKTIAYVIVGLVALFYILHLLGIGGACSPRGLLC